MIVNQVDAFGCLEGKQIYCSVPASLNIPVNGIPYLAA
jgi:hypothetical protein